MEDLEIAETREEARKIKEELSQSELQTITRSWAVQTELQGESSMSDRELVENYAVDALMWDPNQ